MNVSYLTDDPENQVQNDTKLFFHITIEMTFRSQLTSHLRSKKKKLHKINLPQFGNFFRFNLKPFVIKLHKVSESNVTQEGIFPPN